MTPQKSPHAPVPKGYKRTEVGVIPEDWEVKKLDDICVGIYDGTHQTPTYVLDGVPFFSVENITTNNITDTKFISPQEHKRLSQRCKPEKGDIFLTRIGSLGKTKLIDWDIEASFYVSLALLKVSSAIDPTYLYCYSKSQQFVADIENRALLNATPKKINLRNIGAIPIPLPPLPEQRAIAEVLSDVDAYLAALDKLIAKKRAVKTATMQDLLTGRVRLPGFQREQGFKHTEVGMIPVDWEVKPLGFLAKIVSGGTPRTEVPGYWDGHIPWCTPTDITSCRGKYLTKTERLITREGLQNSSATLLPPGALLLCTRATIGDVKIAKQPTATNQGFKSLVVHADKVNNEFLYYALQILKSELVSLGVGSTFLEVSRQDVANLRIRIPSLPEQRAIATILSDMDAEIEALERQRSKVAALKQGMMQELLTGRIRIVRRPRRQHSQAFNEAIVLSMVTHLFSNKRYPIGRKRRTKYAYLLHRYAGEPVDDYLPKAMGPYNPKVKYGGAERIALNKGYVQHHKAGGFIGFIAGDRIQEAEQYFKRWYGAKAIRWLQQIKYMNNEELELFTTVDMAILMLKKAGGNINVATVKDVIRNEPEWRSKLKRSTFSDANIARAIIKLQTLFGTPRGKDT